MFEIRRNCKAAGGGQARIQQLNTGMFEPRAANCWTRSSPSFRLTVLVGLVFSVLTRADPLAGGYLRPTRNRGPAQSQQVLTSEPASVVCVVPTSSFCHSYREAGLARKCTLLAKAMREASDGAFVSARRPQKSR